MNRFPVVVLMLVFAAAVAPAQKTCRVVTPEARAAYIQLHDQMLGWARSEVLPQARTWKARLDGAMEPADLQSLNALRARAAELNVRRIAIMKTMADAWVADNQEAVKAGRKELFTLLPQGLMLLEDLRPLGEKYRSTLEEIGTDARPMMKVWKTDATERYNVWRQQNSAILGSHDRTHEGKGHRGMARFGGNHRKLGAALFMLWDGGDLAGQIGAESLLQVPGLE